MPVAAPEPKLDFFQKIADFFSKLWAFMCEGVINFMAWLAPKPPGFKEALQRIKANDPALTHVDLSAQGLSLWNIIELCNALLGNTHVTSLDVSKNNIGDVGAEILAQNDRMESLDISYNCLCDEGTEAIAHMVR